MKKVDRFTDRECDIYSTENTISINIAETWNALEKLRTIWRSSLPDNMKRNFFRATVESILLYGSSAWTTTKKLENKLDGTYTRMLRAVLNKSWREHPTKEELYGKIPAITSLIKERRTRFAGHCYRSKEELASDLILWIPAHGHTQVGRPQMSYIDQLAKDADMEIEDLKSAMTNRDVWRRRVVMVRATRPTR